MAKFVSAVVLLLTVAATYAQTNGIQGSGGDESYFGGILATLSTMDWQGMLRTVVDAAMQYFSAPTNRIDETSRAMHSFESDLVVNFVEQSPFLRHYAESAHHYIISAVDVVSNFL